MFNPSEIIFATTQACNLHCPHCFVTRTPLKLDVSDAVKFLESCRNSDIYKVGFSGGEPFLYQDFLVEIIKTAVGLEMCFDQIMTNGDWWKTEEDLNLTLQKIYEAGYDGKIGLSYDSFHGQSFERIKTFVTAVNDIFGEETVNVQTVVDEAMSQEESDRLESNLNLLAEEYGCDIYLMPQTFQGDDPKGWQSKKWFKDDFCEGPGQILFVHSTGDIAPCCGFANENKELFIGNIKNHTLKDVLKTASQNKMIDICYNKGLLSLAKKMEAGSKSASTSLPGLGRTEDICTFCDFVCKKTI